MILNNRIKNICGVIQDYNTQMQANFRTTKTQLAEEILVACLLHLPVAIVLLGDCT